MPQADRFAKLHLLRQLQSATFAGPPTAASRCRFELAVAANESCPWRLAYGKAVRLFVSSSRLTDQSVRKVPSLPRQSPSEQTASRRSERHLAPSPCVAPT